MELILSILGIVISLAIAAWEHRRANKAEVELAKAFRELPEKLLNDFARLVGASLTEGEGKTTSTDSSLNIQHADLNGDGKPELLVSFLSGPHNTALQVFGMKSHWEFGLLGEIYGSTPTDFDLEDVNDDGVLEVSVVEISKTPDLPYVMGLRDRVSYKLTGEGFVEVKRVKCYSAEDLREALASWHGNADA
jgi:hypothetical protein